MNNTVCLVCPHCGLKMELLVEQERTPSMMVFICARCKEPLMRYGGEVFDLEKAEFANLRKKLAPLISNLLAESRPREPLSKDSVNEMLALLDSCQDVSEFIDQI